MIQLQTNLDVADNSGARRVMCIKVLGGSKRRYATVGASIVVRRSNDSARQSKRARDEGRRGGRVRKDIRRADGFRQPFDRNAAVLINKPVGARSVPPHLRAGPRELRAKNHMKIISLGPEVHVMAAKIPEGRQGHRAERARQGPPRRGVQVRPDDTCAGPRRQSRKRPPEAEPSAGGLHHLKEVADPLSNIAIVRPRTQADAGIGFQDSAPMAQSAYSNARSRDRWLRPHNTPRLLRALSTRTSVPS